MGKIEITRGDNCLDTCHQFLVKDSDKIKLLNIKIYDKVLDLAGRNGTHLVGSRFAELLGCKRHLSVFNKRLSRAQDKGMTRLEISILIGALKKYTPQQPSFNTQWHIKTQSALEVIVHSVLNHRDVLPRVYS